jgi:hypothetical protein
MATGSDNEDAAFVDSFFLPGGILDPDLQECSGGNRVEGVEEEGLPPHLLFRRPLHQSVPVNPWEFPDSTIRKPSALSSAAAHNRQNTSTSWFRSPPTENAGKSAVLAGESLSLSMHEPSAAGPEQHPYDSEIQGKCQGTDYLSIVQAGFESFSDQAALPGIRLTPNLDDSSQRNLPLKMGQNITYSDVAKKKDSTHVSDIRVQYTGQGLDEAALPRNQDDDKSLLHDLVTEPYATKCSLSDCSKMSQELDDFKFENESIDGSEHDNTESQEASSASSISTLTDHSSNDPGKTDEMQPISGASLLDPLTDTATRKPSDHTSLIHGLRNGITNDFPPTSKLTNSTISVHQEIPSICLEMSKSKPDRKKRAAQIKRRRQAPLISSTSTDTRKMRRVNWNLSTNTWIAPMLALVDGLQIGIQTFLKGVTATAPFVRYSGGLLRVAVAVFATATLALERATRFVFSRRDEEGFLDTTTQCYIGFLSASLLSDSLMNTFDLPHFTPHFLSSAIFYWLCSVSASTTPSISKEITKAPARSSTSSDKICDRILGTLRFTIPLVLFLDGFTSKNSSLSSARPELRMQAAFCVAVLQNGLIWSPVALVSWAFQMIAVYYIANLHWMLDIALYFFGTASIRIALLIHTRRLQTMKSESS